MIVTVATGYVNKRRKDAIFYCKVTREMYRALD
jgi:hypothetical protein